MNRAAYLMLSLACGGSAATASTDAPPFSSQVPPPAPDYAVSTSWAAGPFGPGASAAVPGGATRAARSPRVDVFYVHPTTDLSKTHWNQDVADAKTNAWTDASVIARQASVFNACCRVFAPRYRQASTLNANGEREKALDLAYGDVARAFDVFLRTHSHGRPFIIAGHSQGAWLIARLIEEKIDGTPLEARMVAAYVVGINVAEGDFGLRYKHVPACATPVQTGCIVQWNSLLPSADLSGMATRYEAAFVGKHGDLPGKTTLCINPLTFDRSKPMAGSALARGAVPGDPGEGAMQPLVKKAVAAHCDRGLLIVTPSSALGLKPLPGGAMHYHDIGLFYADVRANAVLRCNAYFKARGGG